MNKVRLIKSIFITLVLLFTFPAFAEKYAGYGDEPTPRSFLGQKEYSPYMDIGHAQRVFWGGTCTPQIPNTPAWSANGLDLTHVQEI